MASLDLTQDRPLPAPPSPVDVRSELAQEFLRGDGVEIGALHLAMAMPPDTHVRYVDRMSVEDLRHHYPELRDWDLAPVDIIDDGEQLTTIAGESLDFIVANHFLEHCEDPIGTIETHLGKLRPGGVLFYAVPDKRYTFDFRRERTPLQHHIDDHEHGPERSRSEHYLQWASFVHEGTGPPSPEQAQAYAHKLEAENYSIHFHVWTESDLIVLMLHIQNHLGNFEIEAVRRHGIENIAVLRKHDTQPPKAALSVAHPIAGVPAPVPVPHPELTRGRITGKDAHIAALETGIDETDREHQRLVEAEQRLASIPELERRIAELDLALRSARAEADRARAESRVLEERLMRAHKVLDDVFNSASWQLTKPLRQAKRVIRAR